MRRPTSLFGWLVVALVGGGVLALVLGLGLSPRLDAGERVVDRLGPVFTPAAAADEQAGINYLSSTVDALDPLATPEGGGAAELPALVSFLSVRTGRPEPDVLTTLQARFPHATALLLAAPLSAAGAEVPAAARQLAPGLGTTPEGATTALQQDYPALHRVVTLLPTVTAGWNAVPGTESLTRLDGTPARTAPQVRDYLGGDVVPLLQEHATDMGRLAGWAPRLDLIAPLLTLAGAVTTGLGVTMFLFSLITRRGRGVHVLAWTAVLLVGAAVLALVLGSRLYPRLDGGARLLAAAKPLFTQERVVGDAAAMDYLGEVVDLATPLVDAQGGAAGEVTQLLAGVSARTGTPPQAVLQSLDASAPHLTSLLRALPLSSASAELPSLLDYLATTLNMTPDGLGSVLSSNFPHLAQAIGALPRVTDGWNNVPGTALSSRMHTATGVREHFAGTLIPALTAARADLLALADPWPALDLLPPVLLGTGALLAVWALLFLVRTRLLVRTTRSRTGGAG